MVIKEQTIGGLSWGEGRGHRGLSGIRLIAGRVENYYNVTSNLEEEAKVQEPKMAPFGLGSVRVGKS